MHETVDPQRSVIVAAASDQIVDGIDIGSVGGVDIGFGARTHANEDVVSPTALVIGFASQPDATGYVLSAYGNHIVTKADDADIDIAGR